MAKTSIEWTERVWNFMAGCSLKSPGCTNCYAMRQAARIERMNPSLAHYHGLTQRSKAGPVWTGKIGFAPHKLTEPLRVRTPARWFVNSMSDLFHEDVPDEIIDQAFAVMALAPHHTFQVLTKRSKRMREYMTKPLQGPWAGRASRYNSKTGLLEPSTDVDFRTTETMTSLLPSLKPQWLNRAADWLHDNGYGDGGFKADWPLPNVWLGVSVEDQQRADERIRDLLATPAAVRWISAEPLLGPVDLFLAGMKINGKLDVKTGERRFLDWVVVGGESGAKARVWPGFDDAARSLRDQCKSAGVPFFMKQMQGTRKSAMPPIPNDLMIRETPHD